MFHPLPAPTDEEIARILEHIHGRVLSLLRCRGRPREAPSAPDPVAGGVFAGFITNRQLDPPDATQGLTAASVATALATKSPDLAIPQRAVFFAALANGSIAQVATISQNAMAEKDVPVNATTSEKSGAHREIKGTKGDLDVTVILDEKGAKLTDVEVTARKNLVAWDKDFAKSLLDRIMASTQ